MHLPQVRIAWGDEWLAIRKVKNANFGYNTCRKIYVIDIIPSLLGDDDICFSEFEGFRKGIHASFWVGFGHVGIWIKVEEEEARL